MWLFFVSSPLILVVKLHNFIAYKISVKKYVRLRDNYRGGGGLNLTLIPSLLPINFTAFTADLTQF